MIHVKLNTPAVVVTQAPAPSPQQQVWNGWKDKQLQLARQIGLDDGFWCNDKIVDNHNNRSPLLTRPPFTPEQHQAALDSVGKLFSVGDNVLNNHELRWTEGDMFYKVYGYQVRHEDLTYDIHGNPHILIVGSIHSSKSNGDHFIWLRFAAAHQFRRMTDQEFHRYNSYITDNGEALANVQAYIKNTRTALDYYFQQKSKSVQETVIQLPGPSQ